VSQAVQQDVTEALAGQGYLADRALATSLRLALALDQQRLAQVGGQEDGSGQGAVGEIALLGERLADRIRRCQGGVAGQAAAASSSARRVSTRARWRL